MNINIAIGSELDSRLLKPFKFTKYWAAVGQITEPEHRRFIFNPRLVKMMLFIIHIQTKSLQWHSAQP